MFSKFALLFQREAIKRDIAQLVAYNVRDVGVASSSLAVPTILSSSPRQKQYMAGAAVFYLSSYAVFLT